MLLKGVLLELERLMEQERERDGPGRMAREILRKAKLTFATSMVMDSMIEKVADALEGREMKASGLKKTRIFFKRVFGGNNEVELEKVKSYLQYHPTTIPLTRLRSSQREGGYSTSLTGNRQQGTSKMLSFFCLTPSIGIRQLVERGTRNVMVVSGTLSPLDVFEQDSGVKFHVQHSGGHVVPKEQIFVASSGLGIRRKALKNTYDRRDDPEQYKELGLTIVSAIKTAPGGVLVFFPSYGNMEECVRRWGGEDLSGRGGKVRMDEIRRVASNDKCQGGGAQKAPYFVTDVIAPTGRFGRCHLNMCALMQPFPRLASLVAEGVLQEEGGEPILARLPWAHPAKWERLRLEED